MYKFSEIEKLLKYKILPLKEIEIVNINNAMGRFLAENIYAKIDIPPANNSAVDGYLFRHKTITSEPILKNFNVVQEIHAGEIFTKVGSNVNVIKVSTGSHIPKGFDVVIMEEDFTEKNKTIKLKKKKDIFKWMNIRKKGEDIKAGRKVFSKGHYFREQDIGMLASLGLKKVNVIRKLRVSILSNGNELVEPGKKKLSHQIYDSNRRMLYSLLKRNYTKVIDSGIVEDSYKKIKQKIIALKSKSDLIIVSGGASSGSKDYIVRIIKKEGTINFWKVSIKPGRPFGLGILDGKIPILIVPGNPVACFVVFFIFGRKLLNLLFGKKYYSNDYYLVKSNFSMKKKVGRDEFLRGKTFVKDGKIYVDKFSKQGAGILSSVVWGNGLIRLKSKDNHIKKDSYVEFYPFNSF